MLQQEMHLLTLSFAVYITQRRLQAGFLGYLVIITAYGLYTTVTGAQ